jgi:hypothetical protein
MLFSLNNTGTTDADITELAYSAMVEQYLYPALPIGSLVTVATVNDTVTGSFGHTLVRAGDAYDRRDTANVIHTEIAQDVTGLYGGTWRVSVESCAAGVWSTVTARVTNPAQLASFFSTYLPAAISRLA